MKVLKFGGTSLASAERMKQVASIAISQMPAVIVLSAVAGTTNALEKIGQLLKAQEAVETLPLVNQLRETYKQYIHELLPEGEQRDKAERYIESQLHDIESITQQRFVPAFEYHLLAKGELISSELFYRYLIDKGQATEQLAALDLLRLDQSGEPDTVYLENQWQHLLKEKIAPALVVTQGYICRSAFGEITNLKRGGSDYSASLFAAAIDAQEVQIWTDIDGMHNNDPRYVDRTAPIRELSFDEAAELAYFGAKILHPSSIKPARKKQIPVRLLNTLAPEAEGSLISARTSPGVIKAVAAKDGITAIKIKSTEMLQAPGFLRRVFEVFELYQTSIDVITTSEVAVSLTIDNTEQLTPIVQTLTEFGRVEVDENLTIICVVGDLVVETRGVAAQVMTALENIPLRMISYGGSAHNITLLVSESLKSDALNALHQGLFDV